LYQKLLKSDNWFSSYSRKCWGCFFKTQCSWQTPGEISRQRVCPQLGYCL